MKKMTKIMSTILMVMLVVFSLSTNVMAARSDSGDAGSLIGQLNPTYGGEGTEGLTSVGQRIISIISTVAIVISVIVLLIIGIKYMMGSASEKAEYKKTMIPYLVGAIIIFGAGAIAQVVVNLATTITAVE